MALERPPHWENWGKPRRRRWRQEQRPVRPGPPPQGTWQNQGLSGPNAPGQGQTQNFLPMTPGWEAGQRALYDALSAGLAQIGVARERVPEQVNLANARLATDEEHQTEYLMEDLADRGVFYSTVKPYLQERDITIPFGRSRQDVAMQAAQTLADLAAQEGSLNAEYQKGLMELLLDRAAEVSENQPLALPQYKNKKKGKKGKKGRRR